MTSDLSAHHRDAKSRSPANTGPLAGIKVFDLTRVLAGPTCVQMLADLGAEVIKIEKPGSGDDTRGFAPPVMPGTRESAYFMGTNRNKHSVTLDISTARRPGHRARSDRAVRYIGGEFQSGCAGEIRSWL